MRNQSIMKGVKILGEFKFIDEGERWGIYSESICVGIYCYVCPTKKIKGESNQALYDRVTETLAAINTIKKGIL